MNEKTKTEKSSNRQVERMVRQQEESWEKCFMCKKMFLMDWEGNPIQDDIVCPNCENDYRKWNEEY